MKKLFKNKQIYCILAAAVIIIVVVVLYSVGFRITYAPELENSWDAVSAVASWVGVIMSFLAVMAAVWIPKRIADKQDKISLFEKRYRVYDDLRKLHAFSSLLNLSAEKEDLDVLFLYAFKGNDLIDVKNTKENHSLLHSWVLMRENQVLDTLKEFGFLFSQNLWRETYVLQISVRLLALIGISPKTKEDFLKAKKEFCQVMENEDYDKLISEIKNELTLCK